MTEPLLLLFNKYGFDHTSIKNIICGDKYHAVILKNGNIGVCSTLNQQFFIDIDQIRNPDINNIKHRIILNAYYNALFNYLNNYKEECDIFTNINFHSFSNIVMIGYFGPLVRKFRIKGLNICIFDKLISHEKIDDIKNQPTSLSKADAVILTATTIFNNTFNEIVEATSEKCKIFVLGPSSPMCNEILSYPRIDKIFGTVFLNNDKRVLEEIRLGGGTKSFSKYSKKVYFDRIPG